MATVQQTPTKRRKKRRRKRRQRKSNGRARPFVVPQSPPAVFSFAETDEVLAESLRRALNTIWFAYQPIVDPDFQIMGHEALLRSREPGLETALPLLESARRRGHSDDLLIQMWTQAPEPFGDGGLEHVWLFMNVEPNELSLFAELARSGPLRHLADRIVLEVSERAGLRAPDGITAAATTLKDMGFRIAVDDFGGAFTSIDTFARLEPNLIKLDGGLIRGVERCRHRQLYLQKMLEMCDDLGVLTVAEQVETRAEFETLRDLGCHYLQGFFVGRPEPLGS